MFFSFSPQRRAYVSKCEAVLRFGSGLYFVGPLKIQQGAELVFDVSKMGM
jgi:hypothetical protein